MHAMQPHSMCVGWRFVFELLLVSKQLLRSLRYTVVLSSGWARLNPQILEHWKTIINVYVACADQSHEKLVHVSVGTQSVWAVTDAGNIYFRTGVAQPLSSPLHPAWLCVNNRKKSLVRFCQVVTSENDLVVITHLALIAHTLVCTYIHTYILGLLTINLNLIVNFWKIND